jgi:hypothetical protein
MQKDPAAALETQTELGDHCNMTFAGTLVNTGRNIIVSEHKFP